MSAAHVLYVATSNAGKLRDFAAAAAAFSQVGLFEIATLPGLSAIAAPAEDADSFQGNAEIKAMYYSRHAPGALVFADDSGLEVDALGGAPGVYSARYAERAGALGLELGASCHEATGLHAAAPLDAATLDAANNRHLLAELAQALPDAGLPGHLDHRTARYRCVLALAQDGACLGTAEGSVAGRILLEARGEGGFGYDPLFYLPALGQTMAELDQATRLRLSHRGEALRAMLPRLAELLR